MAELAVGAPLWLNCDVKPGPFQDERLVRVRLNGSTWVGFVPSFHLDNPDVEDGEARVKARVVSLERGSFIAKVLGHSLSPGSIHGSLDEVDLDPLPAGHQPLS